MIDSITGEVVGGGAPSIAGRYIGWLHIWRCNCNSVERNVLCGMKRIAYERSMQAANCKDANHLQLDGVVITTQAAVVQFCAAFSCASLDRN